MKEFAKKRFFLFGTVKFYARTNRCGRGILHVFFRKILRPHKSARRGILQRSFYRKILRPHKSARRGILHVFFHKILRPRKSARAEYYNVIFSVKVYARTNRRGRMLFYKTWKIIPLFQPFRAQGNRSLPLQTKFSSTDRACSRGAASNCLPEWTGRRNRRKYFYDT